MASPSTETPVTTTNSVSYSTEPKSPSFSSTPPDVTTKHDVFLSFHGKDTRYKFTSHLYEKLTAYGIKTYKDDPDLRIGDKISKELFQAIHDSKIYIVVFSEKYAFSSWCLDECVEIYKRSEEMNRLVVGVYCGIDPSVVRYQTKSFAEAFTKHREGHFKDQPDRVKEWESELEKLAELSGRHISAERSEADIINEILDRIRQEINPNTLDIAKHPVGLKSRVEDIEKLLESTEKEGITKIGIYGMRGVGKTTLAKSLYNHLIKERFKDSCFLADVRGCSEEKLKDLQKQLINNIVKSNKVTEVSSVAHGMQLIEDTIRLTKVLVVIDDLDHQNQFNSLVRKFASGSVVIITTTDEELLRKIIVEPTHRYKVNGLKGAEEVTLFNLHAFGDAKPSKKLEKLSQDVLHHADGLPLALAVFGSHLFNQSEDGWNAFIEHLKLYPVPDVNDKLVNSYDALKLPMLQKFFLDIACFFIGWEKERVVKIMETFYNSSNYYIEVLRQRCLLTINNKNQLRMHGLIVMMGKDIVRKISHEEPEKHSRLWMSGEIRNVLEKKKGTKEIEGIIPSNFYEKEALEGVSLATDTFKMMSKLRFLYLKTVNLTGSFEQTLEDVRWLHWDWCPLQCFPSNFKPEKLAILELPHSKMRTIWEPNMVPKAFETLTAIDMSYSLDLTATPDFTKLPCLETLNFKGCESLEKIHIPDGSLGKLVILNLCGCVKLKSLSNNISKLRALKSIYIGGCISLTGSPTELNAWGQPVLKLPTSIGLLSKSVELNTSDNEFLDTPLTSPATRWDVFLSFRGKDTRYSFTDHLYHGLDAAGIRTFKDEELYDSDENESFIQTVPRAIEESKICVVVLSENYASSAWCLEELVTIMDCHYRHGRMVLPVYYRIKPSVVRRQIDSFGEALRRHDKRFHKEKVDKWRHALDQVANISGYRISKTSPEPEIIQDILFRAKPKILEDVVKYPPVGLETRVKGIINVLDMSTGTEGVTKIGIYGMGGVGKTTLAKALYNKLLLLGSFEDSCFLENVREVSQSTGEGLISLQQKLINDVLKNRTEITIHSVDQGIEIMRDRMSYRKVLVVVDDLDNYNNYYSLVGPLIGSGSVVIITTRDQGILINKLKVDPRYQFLVKELNDVESVALFARHAFENAVSDRLLSKSVELRTSGNKLFDTAPSTTQWDVFLSFSGIDKHHSFTDHLYHGLDAAGIRTFKGDPSPGDLILQTITQAIEESMGFIIILSENYASSTWCLDELVKILDCYYTHRRMVLPVFYHIHPSVFRREIDSFGEVRRHEKRFGKEKVDKWCLALREVAKFTGYHVTPKCRQSEIIQDIVLRAKPNTLEDVKYPVGLETRIKGILDLLNMRGTGGVTRIGIYGMAEVGKTTLAITLYNKLLLGSGFQDSCVLSNVREVSRTSKGLLSLQQQLINDVLKQKNYIMIHNVHQGIKIMRDRMSYRKVLVVVDDLDEYDQYYSLVGPLIGSGSVVIITTRDQDILNKLEVDPRYQILVKELNDAKSVALLDQHAFPNGEWNVSLLEAYSQDILKLAGGLPLALAVYGSLLFARSRDEWKAYIERLQQIPEPKIQLTLKTSFVALECLDPDLQNIFLDIACFFVGRKREAVVMIMESYYSNVDKHMKILKERCLLTINTKDELGMHNLLQMMGREIVRNNCHEEPEKHSRLWLSNNICDVLKQKKGTADIEGIVYSDNPDALKRLSFTMDTFNRMSKLRFLHIKYGKLTGKFENTLQKLTWLCWDSCPLKFLPSDFYLQKLVILELPNSKLQIMWKLDTASQVFGSLKTLNMKNSQELRATPDFKNFPNLETLNLEGCQSLLEIHISIGTLTRLVSLDMGSCRELKCLPDSICDLSTLEVLNIDNCSSLEALPTELGSIASLTHLNANSLIVSVLPDSIERLSKLVELTLGYNKQLETLPDTICNLRALEVLDIGGCSSLKELPDGLGDIKSLRKFNANALSVSELPDSIGDLSKLVEMQLRDNMKLDTLPDSIDSLISLENLDLRYCHNLSDIPELPPNLKWIKADGCKSLDTLSEVSNLKQLEYLYLAACRELTKIQGLADLASLTELHLGGCHSSFLEDTLTEQFFQRQIGFGKQTKIYIPAADFPKWITRSSNGESSLNSIVSTLSLELPPNVSHNFLGMIIGFTRLGVNAPDHETSYSIKNTTSGFTWSGNAVSNDLEAQMMIIPTSIFSVKDGDDRIEITANAEILGIHLFGLKELSSIKKLHFGSCISSLLEDTLTECLFQAYSQFRHESQIYFPAAEFPHWITQSPDWTVHSSNKGSTMSLHLSPNVSHNFLAMILCFKYRDDHAYVITYSVKNTTSGFVWNGRFDNNYDEAQIVILPSSIFLVRDGDTGIELTANAEIVGIRLLYEPKITKPPI